VLTSRSWDFLHVKPQIANGIISKAHLGTGSIIGVIDSGVCIGVHGHDAHKLPSCYLSFSCAGI